MSKNKTFNTKIDDGLMHFTFTNNEGEVFAECHINPTDVGLVSRSQEIVNYFDELSQEDFSTVEALTKLDEIIGKKFDYLLGYEASKTVFPPPYTPTTLLPDGSMLANVVLGAIAEAVQEEVRSRTVNMKKVKKIEKSNEKNRKK